MKKTPFTFPDWINEFVPDDDLFARAYQDVSDEHRAWIKTSIARLYDWYGPRKDASGESVRQWSAGFDSRATFDAVDFAVILFDGSLLSPARLLAALVPALASGVKQVLAVRVGNGMPWRKAILTGLELAGQELVVDMNEVQVRQLFNELREQDRPGSVVALGPKAAVIKASELQAASRISFWRPRFNRMATIWMDHVDSFDLNVLSFMHPDISFTVYGVPPADLPDGFSYAAENFDDFIEAITDVAYVPANCMEKTLRKAKLLLGPGQEGCWVWSDLHTEQFQFHTTAWTIGE